MSIDSPASYMWRERGRDFCAETSKKGMGIHETKTKTEGSKQQQILVVGKCCFWIVVQGCGQIRSYLCWEKRESMTRYQGRASVEMIGGNSPIHLEWRTGHAGHLAGLLRSHQFFSGHFERDSQSHFSGLLETVVSWGVHKKYRREKFSFGG